MPRENGCRDMACDSAGREAEEHHIELVVHYQWECLECTPGERYTYPASFPPTHPAAGGPAVYRWNIYKHVPSDIKICYIGEAAELRRRISHYIKPGPTQHTNIRLARLFQQHIASGGQICLEVMLLHPSVHGEKVMNSGAFEDAHLRRAVEHLLIREHTLGGWEVLNK